MHIHIKSENKLLPNKHTDVSSEKSLKCLWQPKLQRVQVVPNFFHFTVSETPRLYLFHASKVYREFSGLHGLVYLLI